MWTEPDRDRSAAEPAVRTPDLLAELTDFTFALRLAGIAVTIDQIMCFLRAIDAVDELHAHALYRVGRQHLCNADTDVRTFDRVFGRFFPLPLPGVLGVERPKRRDLAR